MGRLFKAIPGREGFAGMNMRNLIHGLKLCCLLLLLSGCQSQPPASGKAGEPDRIYTLGPGDRVRVTVFQHKNLSGEFEIDSTGRVSLPLIRGIQAEGLSVEGLEDAIIARLKKEAFGDTRVSVELAQLRSVCVLGEVKQPGCFEYIYGMRAAAAIAMAGGYTYRARKNELDVTRRDGTKIVAGHDAPVLPGDVIEVDERYF